MEKAIRRQEGRQEMRAKGKRRREFQPQRRRIDFPPPLGTEGYIMDRSEA